MIGVCVEWLKARARSLRWKEELLLLPEELRRTIQYHSWKADWWNGRIALCLPSDLALREGLSAHAIRQASIQRGLAADVKNQWLKTKQAVTVLSEEMEEESACPANTFSIAIKHMGVVGTPDNDNDDKSDDEGIMELDETKDIVAYLEIEL